MNVDIKEVIKKYHPNAKDCALGHIGAGKEALFAETNDDRIDYLVIVRCSHCGIPLSERDATREDRERL